LKYLIFGLGNIGEDYANTRHNIGFIVADALAQNLKAEFTSERYASVCRTKYKGRSIIIVKPTTYMNLSGKAVKYWLQKENTETANCLVIVDEIALPLGTLRINPKGNDGGHNGLIDIIEKLNTIIFPRLRIGIGNDFAKGYQVEYVLSRWTKAEEEILIPKIHKAVDMVKSFVSIGIEMTMTQFNE
jgi:peptidyl-tRNA hydrolase, PTH1 family